MPLTTGDTILLGSGDSDRAPVKLMLAEVVDSDIAKPRPFESEFMLLHGKRLGSGAFGEVYECNRLEDGMRFAVKRVDRFKLNMAAGLRGEEQLRMEAEVLIACNHPNVLKVHTYIHALPSDLIVSHHVHRRPLFLTGSRFPGRSSASPRHLDGSTRSWS